MSAYEIKVTFTALCPACGAECEACTTEAKRTTSVFDRDNPYERCDRRVFVKPCDKCFQFKPQERSE